MWTKLETLMQQQEMSIYALSKKSGVAWSTIKTIKEGRQPAFDKMVKIADALDVSLDYFR